jgi:hypothetical protein
MGVKLVGGTARERMIDVGYLGMKADRTEYTPYSA